MHNPQLPFNCTSNELEKVAISRFRSRIGLLPSQCEVFREPWNHSTVVCLDFVQCPQFLDSLEELEPSLMIAIQELGLGNGVVFRLGKKLMGWKTVVSRS